ncbi:MAG TPA: PLP-dependent aspartate aminotransferase family protein [Spirochaetota bacterium]|nr:PLP-dependent aspartate aminotransferase family protein [Spirochaetota bacterium]HPU89113.1 PLP-dependent aspartate aminotransferase family protein [Spirochaetota bacterium]
MKYDTKILHGAADRDPYTGALSIPIYPASTYHQKNIDEAPGYVYSRAGNPTRRALEETLAMLEGGARAYAFASGVAAITAALTAVLSAGDHIVATRDIYGGSYRLLTDYLDRFGIEHTFADTSDPREVEHAIRPNTRVLFLESPSNPLLKIIDFEAMAAIARARGCITILDNTFLTPYFFRPLDFGIDMSVHSATKFLGGHSDLLAGAVITKSRELGEQVYRVQATTGGVLSPENSWLLLRGIKTLRARMTLQAEGAMRIARWLADQRWATSVYYPGLPEHPGHDILKRQATGFGAVVSFTTDSVARAHAIMKHVQYWTVAVSLGGVESILSYPSRMSHAALPVETRESLGITDTLIRLSVGLEDADDLIEDLARAAEAR